jgi:hypothetical protein
MATSQHGKYLNTNGSQTQFIGLFECHDLSPNGFYRILLRFFTSAVCACQKNIFTSFRGRALFGLFFLFRAKPQQRPWMISNQIPCGFLKMNPPF